MGEMLVQDTSVIATADAIREKIGTSEKLNWVAGKGFADVIQSIVLNSTLPSGVTAIKTGSFIPVQGLNDNTWRSHGLGRTPNFLMIFLERDVIPLNMNDFGTYAICGIYLQKTFVAGDGSGQKDGFIVSIYGSSKRPEQSISFVSDNAEYVNLNTFKLKINTADFKESTSYRWVAAYIEGI